MNAIFVDMHLWESRSKVNILKSQAQYYIPYKKIAKELTVEKFTEISSGFIYERRVHKWKFSKVKLSTILTV